MRSLADILRSSSRAAVTSLAPHERVELAFRLAEDDIGLLSAARGIPRTAAVSIVRQVRRQGRAPSACTESVRE
jgi:hypothetical protein